MSITSPVIIWVCLELNMLMFLPLMSSESGLALENTIKYFLVQSWASIIFLGGGVLVGVLGSYSPLIMCMGLILKLGAAPFHGWFISILKGRSLRILLLLSTLQKCTPLIIIRRVKAPGGIVGVFLIRTLLFTWFSLPGAANINKILALSSIANLAWFLIARQHSLKVLLAFFIIYVILLLSTVRVCNNYRISTFTGAAGLNLPAKLLAVFTLLSLGGLPPLLGFLGKVLTLKRVLLYTSLPLILTLVYGSLFVLYVYVSRSFYVLLNNSRLKVSLASVNLSLKVAALCGTTIGFNLLIILPL